MIDTIVLRIHRISEKTALYEKYYHYVKKQNAVTTAYINEDTGEYREDTKVLGNIYYDSDRVIPISHRSSFNVPSSHYTVSYYINSSQDWLEFNFSVPKYKYSTNVLQFINEYDQSPSRTWLELRQFLYDFIANNLVGDIPECDIEINRIDFCYNQFFNSKDDALRYLDEQKTLLVKYARSSRNNYRTYDTSLMYLTDRYSFKIYHKGTEFEKHDYRELMKNGNKLNLPIEYVKQNADCILRYEMTFRNSMLNYVFKSHFIDSTKNAEKPIVADHPVFRFFTKMMQLKEYRTKQTERWLTNSKIFCLASLLDNPKNFYDIMQEPKVTFDYTLFLLLHDTFWDKLKSYQIGKMLSIDCIRSRINEHNAFNEVKNNLRRKKKSGLNNYRLISTALLAQFMDNWHELKHYMPKRSWQRLKTDMGKIGITENTKNLDMSEPRLDYFDYFVFLKSFEMRNANVFY